MKTEYPILITIHKDISLIMGLILLPKWLFLSTVAGFYRYRSVQYVDLICDEIGNFLYNHLIYLYSHSLNVISIPYLRLYLRPCLHYDATANLP